MTDLVWFPDFSTWGNWDTERSDKLSKVILLICSTAGYNSGYLCYDISVSCTHTLKDFLFNFSLHLCQGLFGWPIPIKCEQIYANGLVAPSRYLVQCFSLFIFFLRLSWKQNRSRTVTVRWSIPGLSLKESSPEAPKQTAVWEISFHGVESLLLHF